jgi:hypothetical protein
MFHHLGDTSLIISFYPGLHSALIADKWLIQEQNKCCGSARSPRRNVDETAELHILYS